jgi:hypothetical protein
LVIFGGFGIGAIVMLAWLLTDGGPPLVFGVLWLAIVAWNGYWYLLRVAGELWLDGTTLHWRAALRSGSIDVAEIVEIRPFRLASNIEVIQLRNGRPILTMAGKGIRELNDSIARQRPGLPVRLGRAALLGERMFPR